MQTVTLIRSNWLTRNPSTGALRVPLLLSALLLLATLIYTHDLFGAGDWMAASGKTVFGAKQYGRLWSALFAHADLAHVLGNLFLFFPFAYALSGYFGNLFFPLTGFFLGGVANFFILKTMPEQVSLVGVSGVVYWMGAAWVTLSFLIDRRESLTKRSLKAIGVSMVLFLPETYLPQVSYLSHAVGYASGVASGAALYAIRGAEFRAAETTERIVRPDYIQHEWQKGWIEQSSFQPSCPQSLIRTQRLPTTARSHHRKDDLGCGTA